MQCRYDTLIFPDFSQILLVARYGDSYMNVILMYDQPELLQ